MKGLPCAGRPRRGLAIPLVLVLMAVFAAIGVGLVYLSRSVGRMSHWYHHSQMACDLAQAGLQEAMLAMDEASRPGAPGTGALNAAARTRLDGILKIMVGQAPSPGPGSPVTLFEGDGGTSDAVTLGLAAILDSLTSPRDFKPKLVVQVHFLDEKPLATSSVGGILPLAAEKLGGLRIVATASIVPEVPGAIAVHRKFVAYRGYKVINILPPVVSKFPLFFEDSPPPPSKLNAVPVAFDPATGDGKPDASAKPLVLKNPRSEKMLNGKNVNTADLAAKFGASFLDDQGWVFLGNRTAAKPSPWQLNLAFGYSATGENHHLVNAPYRQLVGGSEASATAFLQKSEQIFSSVIGCGMTMTTLQPDKYGLLAFTHGFTTDYQDLGYMLRQNLIRNGTQIRFELPQPLGSSALRLMGTADAMSPTVVLGDVDRAYVRQASFYGSFLQGCAVQGNYAVVLYLWKDHQSNPQQAQILAGSFGDEPTYEKHGSGIVREPYLASLVTMLAPRAAGALDARGYVVAPGPPAPPPAAPAVKCIRAPLVETWLASGGQDADALNKLRSGQVKLGGHFDGSLLDALVGFQNLMSDSSRKLVRRMSVKDFLARCVLGDKLKLPGVVLVEGGALALPKIAEVLEGGVVLCDADLTLEGNVQRGPKFEPLTLASLAGNVTVQSNVSLVEAFLVAVDKTVVLPPASDLTVRGGIAAKQIDPGWLGGPGERVVEYVPEFDITTPANETKYLRAYPMDDVKMMVGAAE